MMRVLIALGLLANGAGVALMIAVSGFIFGGQEGLHGEISAVLVWSGIVGGLIIASLAALIAASHYKRPDIGALVAWAPAVIAGVLMLVAG